MSTVLITRADQIETAIDKALEHIPLETLVRGKLVAVKPNDTWASPTDKTGVTQPDTLRAVLRTVKKFAPCELVVTGGAGAAETGIVIASTDAVAADVVGAKLLGFAPQAVRHLWEAGRLSLGETDEDKMNIPALSLREAIEAFTEAAYGRRLTLEHA